MNRDQAQDLLPVITAFARGKDVQFRHITQDVWNDVHTPVFDTKDLEWRIKPLEFPKLPDHLQWHNPGKLTPEQVPKDYRLLVTAEVDEKLHYEESRYWSNGEWSPLGPPWAWGNTSTICVPISTPFPEPPKPKVMAPLEPHDISPTDVLRRKHIRYPSHEHWMKIDAVNSDGPAVNFQGSGRSRIPFKTLMNEWEISRDGAKTWKPCEKESAS